ncbi:hypothetical protein BGW39_006508, partial [Mortierella sp. 14UC]
MLSNTSSVPAAKAQTQKGRILNNLFNRDHRGGSSDTLGSNSPKASASSPIVSSHSPMPQHSTLLSPTTQPRSIVDNNNSENNKNVYPSVSSLHASTTPGAGGVKAASSSSLAASTLTASPSPKQNKRSPMANNNNPLPTVPKNSRPTTTTRQKQQQRQEQPVSDELSYLPVDGAAVVGAGIAEATRHASHASAPYQPTAQYPQSAPYQQQQFQQQQQQQQPVPYRPYQPQPISPFQQPTPAFYSYDNNNSNDYPSMNRFAGGTPPSSSFNTTQVGGSGYEQSHSTINSTPRSSRNISPAPEPNYNLIQTDATLEGLAQRWFAYQAVMKKSYADDPFYKRWTRSKWILLFSTLLLLGYSGAIFGLSLSYIIGKAADSPVVMEFHSNLVYLSFAGSVFGIASALVGLVGIFKENRIWLSYYTIVLWPVFALYVAVGYIAFRRAKQHLRAHIKEEWISTYSRDQRLIVQHNLSCCGFQDPTYYAAYDMRCFPMTTLPGCQHKYSLFEKDFLTTLWT